MPNTTMNIITSCGRSLEEVKAGIRMRMRNMVFNALEIGNDLIEAKEACDHGQWMPFLREIGFSASTAANYMRIAREVGADSKMAQLPYTKILALLAAPPEEREELATVAEDMSAAEIRKLTEERNKAAEAANMETARADALKEELEKTRSHYQSYVSEMAQKLDDKEAETQQLLRACDEEARAEEREKLQGEIDDLRAKVLVAENNRVEVETVPDDYEIIKGKLARAEKSAKELIDAAAEAEERAAAAEAELEELRAEGQQAGPSDFEKMHFAMKSFLMQCEMMALRPEGLLRDADRARKDVERLRLWCDSMANALGSSCIGEGAVI